MYRQSEIKIGQSWLIFYFHGSVSKSTFFAEINLQKYSFGVLRSLQETIYFVGFSTMFSENIMKSTASAMYFHFSSWIFKPKAL
jgi:hypothetical protein